MLFNIEVAKNGTVKTIVFDSERNLFFDTSNVPLNKGHVYHKYTPWWSLELSKVNRLIIMLGLKCNYKCTYCKQENLRKLNKVPNFTPGCVDSFLEKISKSKISPDLICFYGGEPLVYWKSLVKLIPSLRHSYPKARFHFPTNGSLLTREKIRFLEHYNVEFSLSYDGKGSGRTSCLEDGNVTDALRACSEGVLVRVTWHKRSNSLESIKRDFRESQIKIKHILWDNIAEPEDETEDLSDYELSEDAKEEIQNLVSRTADDPDEDFIESDRIEFMYRNGIGIDCKNLHQCGIARGTALCVDCVGNIYACHSHPDITLGNLDTIVNASPVDLSRIYKNQLFRDKCFTCPFVTTCGSLCPRIQNENSPQFDVCCRNKKLLIIPKFQHILERIFDCKLLKITNYENNQTIHSFQ